VWDAAPIRDTALKSKHKKPKSPARVVPVPKTIFPENAAVAAVLTGTILPIGKVTAAASERYCQAFSYGHAPGTRQSAVELA
jgi:hypothetical protein